MFAIESASVWNKFLTSVELLAVIERTLSKADNAVEYETPDWVDDTFQLYQERMAAARLFARAANTAFDAAALNMLTENSVDTVMSLAESSCRHAVLALDMALARKSDLRNVPKYRDHFNAALKSARQGCIQFS